MITEKFVTMYGWVGISIMALLLALVWFKVLPEFLYSAGFIVAASLFIGRLVLRVLLARQNQRESDDQSTER